MHEGKVHEVKKPYACDFCDKYFATKLSQYNHIEIIHKGNKPFKCVMCDAGFYKKDSLERHVDVVHEGKVLEVKKPFQCEFFNSHLDGHILLLLIEDEL